MTSPTPGLIVATGGVVVLSGPMLRTALQAVLIAARARTANGLPASRAYAELAQAFNTAAAAPRHNDAAVPVDLQRYPQTQPTVPIEEAAAVLRLSKRQTQRLAPRLGGKRIAGRWLLDEQAITEHVNGKDNHTNVS